MADPAQAPKLRLGYCDACSPAIPLAVGALPTPPRHFDAKSRTMHTGKTVDIDPKEAIAAGEAPLDFILRMMAKYVTKK